MYSLSTHVQSMFSQSVTHQCWCRKCEQWCQLAGASLSLGKSCHHLESSPPGWLSGSCGCGSGSKWAWASLEDLGCPENGNGNLGMWSQSYGPRNDDSCPGPGTVRKQMEEMVGNIQFILTLEPWMWTCFEFYPSIRFLHRLISLMWPVRWSLFGLCMN